MDAILPEEWANSHFFHLFIPSRPWGNWRMPIHIGWGWIFPTQCTDSNSNLFQKYPCRDSEIMLSQLNWHLKLTITYVKISNARNMSVNTGSTKKGIQDHLPWSSCWVAQNRTSTRKSTSASHFYWIPVLYYSIGTRGRSGRYFLQIKILRRYQKDQLSRWIIF
jgi:hypothetical protein